MLNLTASTLHRSYEYPISPEARLTAAGCVLVAGKQTGSVAPSTGAENEVFVGFSASRPLDIYSAPITENFEVPANGKVNLTHKPEAGTLFSPAKESLTAGGAAGTEVDVGAALAGQIVSISYRYAPTTLETVFMQGHVDAGGAASLNLGTVTTVVAGTIYTTEYDTTKDWSNTEGKIIGCGANGRVTLGTDGEIHTPIPNARVVSAPANGAAELGIYFSA